MEVSNVDFFVIEKAYLGKDYDAVIGIDEAGRGPLAGPVVACAVTVRNFQIPNSKFQINSQIKNSNDQNFLKKLEMIKDSKKLSEKRREELYDFICENFYVGVGICDHATVDRINILEATYLAMKKAVVDLNNNIKKCHSRENGNPVSNHKVSTLDSRIRGNDNTRHIILVDGNSKIPNLSIDQEAIVGGDKFVKSISAASIIAKVTRDRMMREAHKKYPQYNFLQHKGYGTAAHMAALKKYGPCEIHRTSFRPVRDVEDMYRTMIGN